MVMVSAVVMIAALGARARVRIHRYSVLKKRNDGTQEYTTK